MILLDVVPTVFESPVALGAAAVFFLVFLAIAVLAFKMLKRTVKMAFRMTLVALIVLIAIVGSIALLIGIKSSGDTRTRTPRPTANSSK